jgi:DNA-binding PucR family transcriptional regulator
MPDQRRYDDAAVIESAAAVVDRLGARLGDVTQSIHDTLAREISQLRDAPLLDLLGASVEGNVDTVFRALRYDIPIERVEPPTTALEYARRLAQHGVPASALIRAYRLGHQALLCIAFDETRDLGLDPVLGLDVFERLTTVTFRYIDWISQQVAAVYETEREHWLENRSNVRTIRVTEVLDGGDVDVDAVTAAIRYSLRRTHLALVLWFANDTNTGTELVRLERLLRELAEAIGGGSPLFIAADRVSGWGWIPLGADTPEGWDETIRRCVAKCPDAPYVAIGSPLPGVDGFRRSHRQAQNARRVAIAAGSSALQVISAGEPGLSAAALLSADMSDAQAWVHEVLGPLSSPADNDALLRDTLRIFLREGSSYKAAAEELNLHFNSVKYRVQRAVERRGRPITDDRLDVELALLICHWFGAVDPSRSRRSS